MKKPAIFLVMVFILLVAKDLLACTTGDAQCDVRGLDKMAKIELTRRAAAGMTLRSIEDNNADYSIDTYRIAGKSTISVIPKYADENKGVINKEWDEYKSQCAVYVRSFKNGSNEVGKENLYNTDLYAVYSGGTGFYNNANNTKFGFLTTTHSLISEPYLTKDNKVTIVSHKTRIDDIVLLKCGTKSFFAKVRNIQREC